MRKKGLEDFTPPALGAMHSEKAGLSLIWPIISNKQIATGGEWRAIQTVGGGQAPKVENHWINAPSVDDESLSSVKFVAVQKNYTIDFCTSSFHW